eukprot:TRINITY_DN6259_c0_g1_i5.p1 TRINITY_DN6259_c0_g1~~TRINITY_DN6259_c0_g1_i5.p1  ORF type:complete len:131 (+),score=16.03 TRINITY_DN6259_c0_g1_i5:1553-1945(+)
MICKCLSVRERSLGGDFLCVDSLGHKLDCPSIQQIDWHPIFGTEQQDSNSSSAENASLHRFGDPIDPMSRFITTAKSSMPRIDGTRCSRFELANFSMRHIAPRIVSEDKDQWVPSNETSSKIRRAILCKT